MSQISRVFIRGLLTLIPIALTLYILSVGFRIFDSAVGSLLMLVLPESLYVPGLGFVISLILIFLFGLLLNNYLTSQFLEMGERLLLQVPFIKAIYSPLKDLMNLFSKQEGTSGKSVVLVRVGDTGGLALGLVTRKNLTGMNIDSHADGRVAVYFPLSYAMGGYTLMVPQDRITEIDMPVEKAMSLAITGWVKVESQTGVERVQSQNNSR